VGDHDVFRREHGTSATTIRGRRAHLAYEALTPTDDPDQTLGLHTAERVGPPNSAAATCQLDQRAARSTLDG